MSESSDKNAAPGSNADSNLAITRPTPAVLQALYHAVTGKTETFSKSLKKNVLVEYNDIEQLHFLINQTIEHYELLAKPSVTINVMFEHNKKFQYSSWERFKNFQVGSTDVTSAILMKYEFVIMLPPTKQPQRCVISITIDSGLLVVQTEDEGANILGRGIFRMITIPASWRTIDLSIDFVDFLVARNFSSVVEEWFSSLKPLKKPHFALFYQKQYQLISAAWKSVAQLGLAAFFAAYTYGRAASEMKISELAYATALAILLHSIFVIVIKSAEDSVSTKISKCFIPSVILLTEGDKRAFSAACAPNGTLMKAMWTVTSTSIAAIGLNVVASYLFAYLTTT